MHIEDSYEGAVRRLARLSNAGVDLLPSRRDDAEARQRDRMRDLEELATLTTEENERLEGELADARETIQRLQEQLTAADRQRLRELIDPALQAEPRRSVVSWRWLAALAASGLVVAAGVALQPWQYAPQALASAQKLVRRHAVHPWAMPLEPVAAIAPASPVGPAKPVVPPPAPVAAPPVAVAAQAPEKHKPRPKPHHRAAAAQKHAKPHAPAAKPENKDSDPLLGL